MIHRYNLQDRRYIEGVKFTENWFVKSFGQDASGNIYVLISNKIGVDGTGIVDLVIVS